MSESMTDEETRWPGGIAAITLFQEDLAAAKRFYQEIFGLEIAK